MCIVKWMVNLGVCCVGYTIYLYNTCFSWNFERLQQRRLCFVCPKVEKRKRYSGENNGSPERAVKKLANGERRNYCSILPSSDWGIMVMDIAERYTLTDQNREKVSLMAASQKRNIISIWSGRISPSPIYITRIPQSLLVQVDPKRKPIFVLR